MKTVFMILLGFAAIRYMWKSGSMVMQSKIAVAFIGRRGKNHWGAGVTACTGYTKKVLPLKNGVKYRFYFDVTLTDGDIVVEIANGKNVVRSFDIHNRTATLTAEKGTYTVTTRFRKASGDYELKWEEI